MYSLCMTHSLSLFSRTETGSPSFNQFLHLLGETVNLQGFEHFKGGLDNKNNATGTQSLYTVFGGHEIMFHVSTMLPYSEDDRQQVCTIYRPYQIHLSIHPFIHPFIHSFIHLSVHSFIHHPSSWRENGT